MPALRQTQARVSRHPRLLLFSRSGFEEGLIREAAERDEVELVDASQVCKDLTHTHEEGYPGD